MIFSEQNTNISSALAKSWAAIETPKHNAQVNVRTKNGGQYTFEYTDLNGILDAVRPIFIANNLTIMQNSYTTIENNVTLACVETLFLHESGEYVKSYPLKFPAAQSMQDFGGQITYMKRYSLAAMLGIATEKDDDANGASGNSYSPSSKQNGGGRSASSPQYQPQQTTQQNQRQQTSQLANREQLRQLTAALNAAATRTKMDRDAVTEYAKIQLRIAPETRSNQLTTQQIMHMIEFVNGMPAAK